MVFLLNMFLFNSQQVHLHSHNYLQPYKIFIHQYIFLTSLYVFLQNDQQKLYQKIFLKNEYLSIP